MTDKKRLVGQKIEALMEMFPVVAVVGSRQCGKSTLVRAIYPDWKYYDLERPDDYQLISRIDLIVDGSFGFIPIEVKLGTKLNQRMLGPMKTFLKETGSRFGILVNNGDKIEQVAENIIQIPAIYL